MKLTVQLVIEPGDGSTVVTAVATLAREALTDATLGLTLAESKTILAQLQETMVAQQVASERSAQQTCPACGARRRYKGHHQIVVRSLFGTLRLSSPRFRRCACQPVDGPRSSSPLAECLVERTTPERRYLEAKWAALLPFGVTVDCWRSCCHSRRTEPRSIGMRSRWPSGLRVSSAMSSRSSSRAASATGMRCRSQMAR